MRIRSIRPEFWRSSDISVLPIEDRLLFIGLWSYVDDNGVGIDKMAAIAADLFADDLAEDAPETFARVSRGLQNLSERGRIVRYEAENGRYLSIVNWERHQRIDKPGKQRFPKSDAGSAIIRESVASLPEKNPIGEGEKGRRGEGEKSSSSAAIATTDEKDFPDHAHQLSDRLHTRMIENGVKPKAKIPDAWLDAADKLVRIDGYTPEQVAYIIDWSQADEFWKSNILSMPKLREKFEQLKIKATTTSTGSRRPTTTDRINDTLAMGQELQAMVDQQRSAS